MWYIYVVRCSDASLYCGITKCVSSRVRKHNTGKGAKYTRSRKPVALVSSAEVGESKSAALKAEHAFKKLSRSQKLFFVDAGLDYFLQEYSSVHEKNQSVNHAAKT